MCIFEEISQTLQKGRAKLVGELVAKALENGEQPKDILEKGLLAGMSVVGDKFQKNEVFVPEVLIAARAMDAGVKVLKPLLVEAGVEPIGRVCIGTVEGDLHDIGKNLVKMMMESKGLTVHDLGVDVAPDTFVEKAQEYHADIICISALLTTTMQQMADVVEKAKAAGIRDQVSIMVGGAPVTQRFCDSIGADCYTEDAASAADAAVRLCAKA